jgi:glycosyltransferase involved in cell wall biosynthesis
MRIGFDAKRAFLNRTGLGNYSRGVINSCVGHEEVNGVTLYTPKVSESLLGQLILDHPKVTIQTPPVHFSGPLSSVWRSKFICDQITKDGLDIYHGLSNELPKGIKSTGVPSVVTIHDLIFLHYPEYYKAVDRKIYETKVRHACSVATRIIATSEQTADDLVHSLGVDRAKISVVYQGCNPIFGATLPEGQLNQKRVDLGLSDRFMLSVGTIESRKNAKVLVEALKALDNNDINLVLVGRKTTYSEEILSYATALGLTERVKILEGVSTDDLPAIYQAANVFVLPSLMEGFGIPVLEAMTSGTPVVVTENSCLAEVCADAGIKIDPTNADQISKAVTDILENNELRNKMIQKGRERTERFSEQRIVADLMMVYNLAIAEF